MPSRYTAPKHFQQDVQEYYDRHQNWRIVGNRMGKSKAYAWRVAHNQLNPSREVVARWYQHKLDHAYRPRLDPACKEVIDRLREKGYDLRKTLLLGEKQMDMSA